MTEVEIDWLVIDMPEEVAVADEEIARQVADRLGELAEEE